MADALPVPCEETPAPFLMDDGGDDFARPAAYGTPTGPRAVARLLGAPSTTDDPPRRAC